VRLVFAGTPQTAIPSLDALAESAHDVLAVVTRPDAPVGRGRKLTPSPVRARALDLGIDVLTPRKVSEPEFLDTLRALAPDCCAVVAYGALLPESALAIPAHGWVNLHFSVLPAWRGAAPVQHAILAGDDVTGATTFQIERDLDTGPVFGVLTTPIGGHETAGELLDRLAHSGAGLLVDTMNAIGDGTAHPVPQPSDGVSYASKLTTDDAHIDWAKPALHIDRLARACTPAPGTWTTFRGDRLGIGPVRITDDAQALDPGALHATKSDVFVGTGGGAVRLGDVRPAGKPMMSAAAWARGVRLGTDDRLQ
jgi:methionyl-tRNA formyltransferase